MKVIKTDLAVLTRELVGKDPKEYRYSLYIESGNLVDLPEEIVREIYNIIGDMFKTPPLDRAPELRKRFPY